MDVHAVPPALRAKLGPDGAADLVELLDLSQREARDAVIAACTDRFERRLTGEISNVRVEMARLGADLRQEIAGTRADLRQEMATMRADLRQEMATLGATLRQEMAAMCAGLRQELAAMTADLRQEMAAMGTGVRQEMAAMDAGLRQQAASGRVELVKWCFLFWVGQVLAIGGLMSMMLRLR